MRWLVWLFGVMLAWILYEVTSNAVSRATDDPWAPLIAGLAASVVLGGVTVWLVKRRMPGGTRSRVPPLDEDWARGGTSRVRSGNRYRPR